MKKKRKRYVMISENYRRNNNPTCYLTRWSIEEIIEETTQLVDSGKVTEDFVKQHHKEVTTKDYSIRYKKEIEESKAIMSLIHVPLISP